jgi:DNA-binding LytR/AlgR family response regulator
VKALLVDDEPLPRVHLRRMLEAQGVEVAGEASDAAEAVSLAEDLRPDVSFLDIQMPGLSGLQLAGALALLDDPPLLVFVTGYSEYALAAFEQGAVDYLVKPVSAERLMRTLVRLRSQADSGAARERQRDEVLAAAEAARDSTPLRRLPVRGDYSVRLLRIEEVLCAVARERRVFVRTRGGEEFRVYYALSQLERLLPEREFLRVHDSYLVNVEAVEELYFLGNHSYELRLSDGTQVPVGRSRYPALRARFGLDFAPARP